MDYSFFAPAPQPYQYLGLPPTPAHTHSGTSEDFSNSPPVRPFQKATLFFCSSAGHQGVSANTDLFSRTLLTSSISSTPTHNLRLAKAYPSSLRRFQTTNSLSTTSMPTAYRLTTNRTIFQNQLKKRVLGAATVTMMKAT